MKKPDPITVVGLLLVATMAVAIVAIVAEPYFVPEEPKGIVCYSGGVVIHRTWEAVEIRARWQDDGIAYTDRKTGARIRIVADCVIRRGPEVSK